jgi:hypothetical protein
MGVCYACGALLEVGAFAPDSSKASGRKSICRECDNERSREWYRANRERRRVSQRAWEQRRKTAGGGAS